MATFQALYEEIEKDLSADGQNVLLAEIKVAINDAVDHWALLPFWFNQGDNVASPIATVAGTASYSLPTDLLVVTHARMVFNGSNVRPLIKRDWEWYLEATADGAAQATPSDDYAIYGDKIWPYYPVPSAAAEIELYYLKALSPHSSGQSNLASTGDTNAWTTAARLLIKARAKHLLFRDRLGAPQWAQLMLQAEQEALLPLLSRTGRQVAPGAIAPTQF